MEEAPGAILAWAPGGVETRSGYLYIREGGILSYLGRSEDRRATWRMGVPILGMCP